jgi:hypothetical protein
MDKRPGAPMTTGLRDALQRNDGKMATPAEIADVKSEPGSGLAANQCLGRGARRTPGPARARLEAGQQAGWSATVVDLVWSGHGEPRVRPVAVVPGDAVQECGTPCGSGSCSSRVYDRLAFQAQAHPSRERFEKTVAWGASRQSPRNRHGRVNSLAPFRLPIPWA